MRVLERARNVGLGLGFFILAGCASQIMEGYVGKSITEPMLDYGKPTSVFDLPNGQRAFQWNINNNGVMPITTPTTSTIYGTNGWASVTTNQTNYVPYSNNCVYTLMGEQRGDDWIVVGFRQPRLDCE